MRRSPLRPSLLVPAACALLLAGCIDPFDPEEGLRAEGELTFVRFAAGAPPLQTAETRFYAHFDHERAGELRLAGPDGAERLARLVVPSQSLFVSEAGTTYGAGDSVQITLRHTGGDRFVFELSPALRLNVGRPARLEISYRHGTIDAGREPRLAIWRQAGTGGWARLGSTLAPAARESSVTVTDLGRYGLAAD